MKVYFNNYGEVKKIKNERDGRPYSSITGYRKNMSKLNAAEKRAVDEFYIEEAINNQIIDGCCLV